MGEVHTAAHPEHREIQKLPLSYNRG
jgi:hypothetical protein